MRVIRRIAFWGLLLPCVLVSLTVATGWVSARVRERGDRATLHPAAGEFVTAYDTRIFVQRTGNPHSPAVVFISGTAGWSGLWLASMTQAVDRGYQAVAVDLPPFGYSYPAPTGNYCKREQGRRLIAVLEAMHLNGVTIVAHSIGAAPVVEAVFLAPARFHALVLVDPALGLDGPVTDGADTTLQALLRHPSVAHPVAAMLTNPMLTAPLLRRVISEKGRATPDWLQIYQQPFELRDASAVTLIWGATDTITPLAQGRHLERIIPGARLVTIPRAGHGPQIEEPQLFEAALRDALGFADDPPSHSASTR